MGVEVSWERGVTQDTLVVSALGLQLCKVAPQLRAAQKQIIRPLKAVSWRAKCVKEESSKHEESRSFGGVSRGRAFKVRGCCPTIDKIK